VTSGYALYMAGCGGRSWFEFLVVLIRGDAGRLAVSRWYGRYSVQFCKGLRKTGHDFTSVISKKHAPSFMTSLFETVLFNSVASSKQFSVQDHCFVLCVGNNSVQNIDQENKREGSRTCTYRACSRYLQDITIKCAFY